MTGEDVKRIRKQLEYSQAQFARAMGINLRTLQGWEQGQRNIGSVSQKHLKMSLRSYEHYLFNQGIDKRLVLS